MEGIYHKDIPNIFIMIGLPGSGKSSYAVNLANYYNAKIFSSDKLREELFGSEEIQGNNEILFKELHKRIKECLINKISAIYDATNLSYKKRKAFLDSLKNIKCYKVAIFMATPYEECLKRNLQRDRKVPEDVIERMYKSFNAPYYYEGFQELNIVYSENSKNSFGTINNWVQQYKYYNQENSHHSLSLGEHCFKSTENFSKVSSLYEAAMIHDCGKPFCQTNINTKGEICEEKHYYNHENVGAYDSFFFDLTSDHFYIAQLIQWHMRPYVVWKQSKKAEEKDRNLIGQTLYQDIILLHLADKAAH